MVTYPQRFLVWWGLLLFLCKLGRVRQLDYQLRDNETFVLDNANALARTHQESLPVYGTLSHFLGHVGSAVHPSYACSRPPPDRFAPRQNRPGDYSSPLQEQLRP